jgi:tetratricopeptide (TPR) repeat protein
MKRLTTRAAVLVGCVVAGGSCSSYVPIDSEQQLRAALRDRLSAEQAASIVVPFALPPEVTSVIDQRLLTNANERRRVDAVLDYIFSELKLEYSLAPTRDAAETFRSRRGNCLSFTNLFVAIARRQRLNPFYVEVTDYQRWNYRDGQVVSQGHIVAGLYVANELQTFDFLPYRPKSYKSFRPIDEARATAHFYNNLGAEALFEGDIERAAELIGLAHRIAPDFVKATNNLGVVLSRQGRFDEAAELFRKGLAFEPEDIALLTNLAALERRLGRRQEAEQLLASIEGVNNTNPFFFLAQAEAALAANELDKAKKLLVEALRRDSEAPEVHVGFVKFYLAEGDYAKARHHLARALRADPSNGEAQRLGALLAVAKGSS